MKKLLNVLSLRRIMVIIAAVLILLSVIYYRKAPQRIAAYDYRVPDSFRAGMPDYGLYRRKNILHTI